MQARRRIPYYSGKKRAKLFKRLQNIRYLCMMLAELWQAKRASGAPWVSKSTHPRKFGNHVAVHRPPAARPSAARPFAPQGNQCSITHFLA